MKNIYDALVQFFSGSTWGQYIARSNPNPNANTVKMIFQQENYLYAFCVLVFMTVAGITYYYFILNNKNGSGYGYKFKSWLTTLLIIAVLTILITIFISWKTTDKFSMIHPFRFAVALGISNGLYVILAFFLFSCIVKRFSNANRTPF